MAIFKIGNTDSKSEAAILEADPPSVGDSLWVVAKVRGGVPEGELVHPAKVIFPPREWIFGTFDNPDIITAGASGAPVFNAAGKLVGVYSAHGEQNGKINAFVIPAALILKAIHGEPLQ